MSDNVFEMAWRRELLRRLESPMKRLVEARSKEQAKFEQHLQKLAGYESFEDAQDAYGYGYITMKDLDRVRDILDGGKDGGPGVTIFSAAMDELGDFVKRLSSEIRSFAWEMLPDEEKERIKRESEERRQRRIVNAVEEYREYREQHNVTEGENDG